MFRNMYTHAHRGVNNESTYRATTHRETFSQTHHECVHFVYKQMCTLCIHWSRTYTHSHTRTNTHITHYAEPSCDAAAAVVWRPNMLRCRVALLRRLRKMPASCPCRVRSAGRGGGFTWTHAYTATRTISLDAGTFKLDGRGARNQTDPADGKCYYLARKYTLASRSVFICERNLLVDELRMYTHTPACVFTRYNAHANRHTQHVLTKLFSVINHSYPHSCERTHDRMRVYSSVHFWMNNVGFL